MSAFFIRRIILIGCPVVSSMVSKGMVDKQKVTSITIPVSGMTCAACVSHIENSISKLAGGEEALVNLATETAKVRYIPGFESISSIMLAITNAGYASSYLDKEELG